MEYMKVVRQISTGKILYRSSPNFEEGKGILNARFLFPNIPEADMVETGMIEADALAEARSGKKAEAKAVANKKIVAIIPEWKQRNYTARTAELLKKQLVDGAALTRAEKDELTAMQAIWDRVKAIRTSSDAIESKIDGLTRADDVNGYVIEPNALWSE